ncbi:hypothetical protein SLE2022_076030 [Rubroshorea leprosula]
MNQGFWMAKGAGCLNDGEMSYDNSSRVEPKRSHQWFMDGPDTEHFPNKKQTVNAVPATNLFSGLLNSNVSPWGNTSSFHSISGHFGERLFDPETARTVNFDDHSIPSVNSEKVDMARKANEDLFGNDSSFGLSMSHTYEDFRSGLNYGGIRKVKVSEVKDSENVMPVPISHAYDRVDANSLPADHAYKVEDRSVPIGLAYNKGNENIMSIGDTYDREHNVFISMGQSYNKGEESVTLSETYKDGSNAMAIGNTFDKTDNNFITMGQTYNRADENSISMCHTFSKVDDGTISLGHTYDKSENHTLSIGQSFTKGESTIISFGGYDDDDASPGRLISNYDLLVSQASIQRSEALNDKDIKSNADALVSSGIVSASGAEVSRKKDDPKTSKKVQQNNFPSNVRSLLSTGMLDGVPVKYIAWSQEKELRGVIKGSGYQCGCQSCNFSKVINAYEFERHAGCKTKHPNNHIYFENGKTIYGIVQELRSTPQNMLFDIIQTCTGSPINQKSFRLWKESFLAATRELQRIYGNDDGKQLSDHYESMRSHLPTE